MSKLAFEQAITKDRYDWETRKVYADWLEENGFDDEAVVQREWTPEKQKAEDWLRNFAADAGVTCTNYDEVWRDWSNGNKRKIKEIKVKITYEMVIQAGHDLINHDDAFCQMGSEEARDILGTKETLKKFWECWSLVTGIYPSEEKTQNSPFTCSC